MPDPFQSRPVRLHWAGWETDTYRLQQAGWSLSAEQDVAQGRMRIAMRHEGYRIYGLTHLQDWYFMDEMRYMNGTPDLQVQCMASRLDATIHQTGPFSFQPIDAVPQFMQRERRSIEDFAHFATPLARTREIILPEESVPDLLERILKLQQPAKTERLKRELAEDRAGMYLDAIPRQKFHAQILSIAA